MSTHPLAHGPRSGRGRTLLRGLAELLMTAGVVLLLFVVYELAFTGIYTAREQSRLDTQLAHTWAAPVAVPARTPSVAPPTPALGTGLTRIYLPRLGKKAVHVVVEGVDHEDLKKGPGHLPGSALPGSVGNVVISGHRTTYGAPFNRVDELRVGDSVVLETRLSWFTYHVTGETVVAPTAVQVTFPVPGQRGATPTRRLLTLTTCTPKYSARSRLIVHAELFAALAKGPGVLPPALSVLSRALKG